MENSLYKAYQGKISTTWVSRALKRSFDVVVSAVALFFLVPLFGLIAIAIKRDSEGPVFFGGSRVGRGGKVFKIWKFRTMYEDPESYNGPKVTAKGDSRITPLGQWLRDTKLNELPQFWNVMKGEMSMVGPRPEDPSLAEKWPGKIGAEILTMQPGITSPATIIYHDEESILNNVNFLQQYIKEIGPDKLRLDQLYVQHHSFMLDLDILLWTFLILLPKIRSSTPPEELLFVGPFTRLVRRYMNWMSLDMMVTFIVVGLTSIFWGTVTEVSTSVVQTITMAFIISLIFSLTGAAMGVNKINWTKASPYNVLNLLPAWLIASAIAIGVNWSLDVLPFGLIVLASLFSLGGFVTTRYSRHAAAVLISRLLKRTGKAEKPCEQVIIIGSGRTAEHVCGLLDHPSNVRKFEVVGVVDDDLFTQGMSVYGKKVLGRLKDLPELLDQRQVNLVFLASHTVSFMQEREIAELCAEKNIKSVVIPDIFGSIQNLYEEAQEKNNEKGSREALHAYSHCDLEASEFNSVETGISSQMK